MSTYVLVDCVVFFAGVLHALSGFGAALFALPFLTMLLGVKAAIPLATMLAFTSSIIIFVQVRKHIHWKNLLPLFMGAVPFIPVGVHFLKVMHRSTLEIFLGILLVGYAAYGLAFRGSRIALKPWWGALFGMGIGFCSGAIGAGGPLAVTYTSLTDWSKDTMKGTLQAYFLVSGTMVITFHAINGLTTRQVVTSFLFAAPLLLAGLTVGNYFYRRLGDSSYRRLLILVLGVLGAVMLVRAA